LAGLAAEKLKSISTRFSEPSNTAAGGKEKACVRGATRDVRGEKKSRQRSCRSRTLGLAG
jgi:hypothetical protein